LCAGGKSTLKTGIGRYLQRGGEENSNLQKIPNALIIAVSHRCVEEKDIKEIKGRQGGQCIAYSGHCTTEAGWGFIVPHGEAAVDDENNLMRGECGCRI
jgi:hypothetical protein